jgi:hypothetical protein
MVKDTKNSSFILYFLALHVFYTKRIFLNSCQHKFQFLKIKKKIIISNVHSLCALDTTNLNA